MVATMVAGDLFPDLKVTIGDSRADANFTPVQASQCRLVIDMPNGTFLEVEPDSVEASPDGHSLTLVRAWVDGETDVVGHMWVSARVTWGGSRPQTFPDEGPLRLDVARRSGT